MKINEVIKQIRMNLELSQTAFAEQLGVSFSTVNRWENDKAVPNRLAVKAIRFLAEENNISNELIDKLNSRMV